MEFDLPEHGFVFYPVGTGDSTTIAVDEETIVQVDLRALECADEEADPHFAIVDALIERLPERDGKRYLAAFGLTHADKDHCLGFKELLGRDDVIIGELWFSPRVLWEHDDLSEDAKAFCAEAERRIKVNCQGPADSGDRIRVIGDHDVLDEYDGLPEDCLMTPGQWFTELDGEDKTDVFHAFIHAPFREDAERDRNATSMGLKITLTNYEATGRVMLLGDLEYPAIRRIFDRSDADALSWNLFLAPHHCADSVMYCDNEQGVEELKQDILDDVEANAKTPNWIVASCDPIPTTNKPGDNPPHARAKREYEKIADEFLVTGEWPNRDEPEPMVFELTTDGLVLRDPAGERAKAAPLTAAIAGARGDDQTPSKRTAFGRFPR